MERFFKRPWLIIAVLTLITVFFALQLPRVQIDNNTVNFLPKDNPIRVMSDYVDDTFGGSLSLMVGLERPYGTVFDTEFLNTLKRFTNDISRHFSASAAFSPGPPPLHKTVFCSKSGVSLRETP
jgi:predicted RND superfamily exporter protein